jgi:hypothetical protein
MVWASSDALTRFRLKFIDGSASDFFFFLGGKTDVKILSSAEVVRF